MYAAWWHQCSCLVRQQFWTVDQWSLPHTQHVPTLYVRYLSSPICSDVRAACLRFSLHRCVTNGKNSPSYVLFRRKHQINLAVQRNRPMTKTGSNPQQSAILRLLRCKLRHNHVLKIIHPSVAAANFSATTNFFASWNNIPKNLSPFVELKFSIAIQKKWDTFHRCTKNWQKMSSRNAPVCVKVGIIHFTAIVLPESFSNEFCPV